jgi:hypothetical protein
MEEIMEIKKSLNYKVETDKFVFILVPKDLQNAVLADQEELINRFFDTFNITITGKEIEKEFIKVPAPSAISPRPARKARSKVLEIWNNIKDYLNDEFTADEYWEALFKGGYDYKGGSKDAIPYQQINKLIKLSKIERTEIRPAKWKKIYLKTSEEGVDETIKALKEGKKAVMGVIE